MTDPRLPSSDEHYRIIAAGSIPNTKISHEEAIALLPGLRPWCSEAEMDTAIANAAERVTIRDAASSASESISVSVHNTRGHPIRLTAPLYPSDEFPYARLVDVPTEQSGTEQSISSKTPADQAITSSKPSSRVKKENRATHRRIAEIDEKQVLLAELNAMKTRQGSLQSENAKLVKRQAGHNQELLAAKEETAFTKNKLSQRDQEVENLKKEVLEIKKLLSEAECKHDSFKIQTAEREGKAKSNWEQGRSEWKATKKERDGFKKENSELRAWKQQHLQHITANTNDAIPSNTPNNQREDMDANPVTTIAKLRLQLADSEKNRKEVETALREVNESLKNSKAQLKTATEHGKHVAKIAVAQAKEDAEMAHKSHEEEIQRLYETQQAHLARLTLEHQRAVETARADALSSQKANIARLTRELRLATTAINRMRGICEDFKGRD